MAGTFTLRVVTPETTVLDESVQSVRFHGIDGDYGIQANHAALMTATEPGVLHYTLANGEGGKLLATDGFAEMRDNVLSIVCEAGEDVSQIDVERARRAEQRARERLKERASLTSENVIRAEAALRRSLARQLAAGHRHGQGRADI